MQYSWPLNKVGAGTSTLPAAENPGITLQSALHIQISTSMNSTNHWLGSTVVCIFEKKTHV